MHKGYVVRTDHFPGNTLSAIHATAAAKTLSEEAPEGRQVKTFNGQCSSLKCTKTEPHPHLVCTFHDTVLLDGDTCSDCVRIAANARIKARLRKES